MERRDAVRELGAGHRTLGMPAEQAEEEARVQQPTRKGTWAEFGRRAQSKVHESALPAGTLDDLAADEALADTEAVEHVERVFSRAVMEREAEAAPAWDAMRERMEARRQWNEAHDRDPVPVPPPWHELEHSLESLLIGTAVRLAAKARECAGCAMCPLQSAACQRRRAKGHCPMHTLRERVDDIEHLYGAEFAGRVLEVVSRLAPAELGTTTFDASRAHRDGRLAAAVTRRLVLSGRLTPDDADDAA